MNKVMFSGNLCNNPELVERNGVKSCGVRLAVKRPFKTNGQYESDFISMSAFSAQAELIAKYCKKGDSILVIGRLQNNNYEKDGKTVYQDKVIIESVEFLNKHEEEEKPNAKPNAKPKAQPKEKKDIYDMLTEDDDFKDSNEFNEEITEDDLPF